MSRPAARQSSRRVRRTVQERPWQIISGEIVLSLLATVGCITFLSLLCGLPRASGNNNSIRFIIFVLVANAFMFLTWRHYIFFKLHVPPAAAADSSSSLAWMIHDKLFYRVSCIIPLLSMCHFPIQHFFPHALLDPVTGDPPLFHVVCSMCSGVAMVLIGNFVCIDMVFWFGSKVIFISNCCVFRSTRFTPTWKATIMDNKKDDHDGIGNRKQIQTSVAQQNSTKQMRFRATLCVVLTAAITCGGITVAREDPVVNKITVPISHLPEAIDGFRIVHLSDLHIGVTVGRTRMQRTVHLANNVCRRGSCDLFALTGDVVDADPDAVTLAMEPLRHLQEGPAKLYVTGNHEHIHGEIDKVLLKLQELGVQHLANNNVRLPKQNSHQDQLVVAGVYDLDSPKMTPNFVPNVQEALHGATPGEDAIVLLAHQPNHFHEARLYGVDLLLSGHTHAGQLLLPGTLLAWLYNTKFAGYYPSVHTAVYVSAGTHWWGPPMRFTTHHHEITDITLVREH